MEAKNTENINKSNFKHKAVELLENRVSKTITNVFEHEKKQNDFLKDIRKLNHFLAEELENNKNHNTRKDECKEKLDEMKLRISNVKENLNSARNCLIKALNNKNIKNLVEN
jgi:hypothetical protein